MKSDVTIRDLQRSGMDPSQRIFSLLLPTTPCAIDACLVAAASSLGTVMAQVTLELATSATVPARIMSLAIEYLHGPYPNTEVTQVLLP